MSVIKDAYLADQGIQKIEWVKDFMPVLTKVSENLIKDQVFADCTVGMSIHMEAKTAFLAMLLRAAGAQVYATGCNPLSTQDDVAAGLASLGVEVYAVHGVDFETYRKHLYMVLEHRPNLIIDDGGDLLEAYLGLPDCDKFPVIGGCEETTTGILRLEKLRQTGELPFPMMNVNDACCKHFYDNRYGTGQSVWDAIMHVTNVLVAGKTVVVAGYGFCGKGIAMRARGMGARVIVTEIDPIKAIEANLDGYKVMTMDDAAPLGDFFVTATGCEDVIVARHFRMMKDNAFLANAGHFNVEINLSDLFKMSEKIKERRADIVGCTLESSGKTLNVLAEGRLVNLAAGNGHPAEIMDMSFALQALGLEYLVKHQGGALVPGVYDIPYHLDRYVAWTKLSSMGIDIDRLTPKQRNYLGL